MNSLMRISVEVDARAARAAIRELRSEIQQLRKASQGVATSQRQLNAVARQTAKQVSATNTQMTRTAKVANTATTAINKQATAVKKLADNTRAAARAIRDHNKANEKARRQQGAAGASSTSAASKAIQEQKEYARVLKEVNAAAERGVKNFAQTSVGQQATALRQQFNQLTRQASYVQQMGVRGINKSNLQSSDILKQAGAWDRNTQAMMKATTAGRILALTQEVQAHNARNATATVTAQAAAMSKIGITGSAASKMMYDITGIQDRFRNAKPGTFTGVNDVSAVQKSWVYVKQATADARREMRRYSNEARAAASNMQRAFAAGRAGVTRANLGEAGVKSGRMANISHSVGRVVGAAQPLVSAGQAVGGVFTGAVNGAVGAVQRFNQSLSGMSSRLMQSGKDLQWTGRIMSMRFTLPILLAGGYAMNMALEFERSMTRIEKVYGDSSFSDAQIEKDMEGIRKGIFMLSDAFGIHAEDVADIAGIWAQAGASGSALLKMTRLTMEAMILGDFATTEDAVHGLITTIQAYSLSMDEAREALALLNYVENESAASMPDLIEVLTLTAGAARSAGVDINHLTAMTAAMVPTAGSAARVGNALKSALQRIMTPRSAAAANTLRNLGLEIDSVAWQSSHAASRLEQLARALEGATQPERSSALTEIFGVHQASRVDTLLQDMMSSASRYHDILDKLSSGEAINMMNRELQTLLASDPRTLEILTNRFRNMAMQGIMPLIPLIITLTSYVVDLATWLGNLAPAWQIAIVGAVLLVAAIGPLVSALGSLQLLGAFLIGALGVPFKLLGATLVKVGAVAKGLGVAIAFALKPVGLLGTAFVAVGKLGLAAISGLTAAIPALATAFALLPVWIKVAIVAGLAVVSVLIVTTLVNAANKAHGALGGAFTSIGQGIVNTVGGAMNALPGIFGRALTAVVQVVARAAKAVYQWLRWMNPFVRHSPSLVESVQSGTSIIAEAYRKLADRVISSMGRITAATRQLRASMQDAVNTVRQHKLNELMDMAVYIGGDAESVRVIHTEMSRLEDQMAKVKIQIDEQKKAVDHWKDAIDGLNKTIEIEEKKLRDLEKVVSDLNEQIAASQQRIQDLRNTPVAGTYAFEDALFANRQSAAAIELQIKRLELALHDAGYSYAEVQRAAEAAKEEIDESGDALAETGEDADALTSRLARLATEIDGLRGERLDLILAGAGSDVLGGLSGQIDIIEAERRAIAQTLADQAVIDGGVDDPTAPGGDSAEVIPPHILAMVDQLDALKRDLERINLEGDILSLEEEIDLGPVRKQIEDLFRIPEMAGGDIISQIVGERAKLVELEAALREATQAVEEQKLVIEELNLQKEELDMAHQAEVDKLDALQDQYDKYSESVREAKEALDELQSTYNDLKKIEEEAKAAAGAAGGGGGGGGGGGIGEGDFEVPGGSGMGFTDEMSIDDLLADWEAEFQDGLQRINLKEWFLEKLQTMWDGIVNWFATSPLGQKITEWVTTGAAGIWKGMVFIWNALVEGFTIAWNFLAPILSWLWDQALVLWENGISPLIDELGKIWEAFKELVETAWPYISEFAERIGGFAKVVIGLFAMIVSFLFDDMIPRFERAWNFLTTFLGGAIKIIGSLIEGWLKTISGLIKIYTGIMESDWGKVWEGIKQILSAAWEFIKTVISVAWDNIKALMSTALWFIEDEWNKTWDKIKGKAGDIWDWLKEKVDTVWEAIKGKISDVWNWITDDTQAKWTAIQTKLNSVGTWASTTFSGFFNTAKELIIGAFQSLSGGVEKIWGAIKRTLDTIGTWLETNVVSKFTSAKESILGALGGIATGASSRLAGIANAIKNPFNRAIGVFNNFRNKISGWLGSINVSLNIPSILPLFASGGTLDGGGLKHFASGGAIPSSEVGGGFVANRARAIVGEGSKVWPEFVIPTDPRYRSRALGLLASAANKIGFASGGEVPQYAAGGTFNFIGAGMNAISRIGDAVSSGWDAVTGWGGDAAKEILKQARRAAGAAFRESIQKLWNDAKNALLGAMANIPPIGGPVGLKVAEAVARQFWEKTVSGNLSRAVNRMIGLAAGGVVPMANGGIVRGGRGGIFAHIGEERHDEAVIPLDGRFSFGGGKKEYHFHGDLVFPNITDPADVEDFIRNLEALAE